MPEPLVNTAILGRFARLLKRERLGHAYLLAGPSGMGKSQTALAVAQLVNCESSSREEGPCGSCPSCVKSSSGNHPDIYWVDVLPDEDTIKIAQIREVIARLQMRAFESPFKVCIIKNIERMTAESSNALLKTLEEPSRDTLLLLTTSVPEENLATVVSRCQVVKFYPLSVSALRDSLSGSGAVGTEGAQCLAWMSQGCPGSAATMLDDDFIRAKNLIIDQAVLRADNDVYLKKVLGDKDQTRVVLSVMLTWFRDLLILKSGGSRRYVVHLDRFDELSKLEKNFSFEKISVIIDEIVNSLRLLGENLNIKIPFALLREKIWAR